MKLKLHVWRQNGPNDKGSLETIEAPNVSPDQSFLEMLDDVNQALAKEGKDVIAFDHDCREGICGMCSQVINGVPHGGMERTTVCQLHMREFEDGDEIFIEPWKARAFPVIKDLVVDRIGMERIMQAGGYTSCHTGGVADALAGHYFLQQVIDGFQIGKSNRPADLPFAEKTLFKTLDGPGNNRTGGYRVDALRVVADVFADAPGAAGGNALAQLIGRFMFPLLPLVRVLDQALDRPPSEDVLLDDLLHVVHAHAPVPYALGVDDHGRTVGALVEAAGLVGPDHALEAASPQRRLEAGPHRRTVLLGAAATRMALRTDVFTDEEMMLEACHAGLPAFSTGRLAPGAQQVVPGGDSSEVD